MKLSINKKSQSDSTLVVFVEKKAAKSKKDTGGISCASAPKSILNLLNEDAKEGTLTGAHKETVLYRNVNLEGHKNLLVVGLGSEVSEESRRQSAAAAHKCLLANKIKDADFHADSLALDAKHLESAIKCGTEGVLLSDYAFDEHKTVNDKFVIKTINFITDSTNTRLKKALEEGQITAECINFSRNLGDNPGNIVNPITLAKRTQDAAKGIAGLKVTVWDKARIKKEKMGGLLGVALGGGTDPRFIIMEYNGAAKSKKPVCFVGKGLTFDSGGISIKPSAAMDEMKYDMCGGANVIGTLLAIAKLKLKVNAIGLVPATENMSGELANKPGDILIAKNGKSVEVLNTDAEGRLILMDALAYASELKPAAIFDAATLTGAMVMALGNSYTGVFTRNMKLRHQIENAADRAGEMVWPMPIHDHHVEDMKGIHADLSNISSFRGAGSSTAAAFLEQFVDQDIPWAHFDIAGTGWNCANRINYFEKKGATGCMIRTFVELAKEYK